jgi:hypothetical protein
MGDTQWTVDIFEENNRLAKCYHNDTMMIHCAGCCHLYLLMILFTQLIIGGFSKVGIMYARANKKQQNKPLISLKPLKQDFNPSLVKYQYVDGKTLLEVLGVLPESP